MKKSMKYVLGSVGALAILVLVSPILVFVVYLWLMPAPVLVRIANGSGQPVYVREVKVGPVHRRWPVHKGKETFSPLMPSDPKFAPMEPYYLFGDEAGREMYSARYHHIEFASRPEELEAEIIIRRDTAEKPETLRLFLNHDSMVGCQFLIVIRETEPSVTECYRYTDEAVK
ncbi:MAG: hypothetical protein ACFE0S_12560 [Rhodospirillales bacterium]